MKHIGKALKEIIEERGIKKSVFAEQIGFQHAESLSRLFKSKSIQCDLLDKVCTALGVSPSFFFDETAPVTATAQATTVIGNANASASAGGTGEVAALRALVAEKERTIQFLLSKIGTKTGQNA